MPPDAGAQGPWDTRFVVRDSYAWNFLEDGDNRNRLTALYAETRYAPENLFGRVGRQTVTRVASSVDSTASWVSWGPRPDLRLNGVVGSPVDTIQGLRKIFAGGERRLRERPAGNLRQRVRHRPMGGGATPTG